MLRITRVDTHEELARCANADSLAGFLHESLKPFDDPVQEVRDGIDYAMSELPGMGGFILLAHEDDQLAGALVMLRTGMKGYIPPNLILYVAVSPPFRGGMVGHRLMTEAIAGCEGDVKLHVEYDNHAKKYYEAIGFRSKYADMRLSR
ncbi:GNAT family N-acetyltransferase [Candidatus Fermentibacterales bacterium]|nr:GNAT family N-acetyltransferase [Candidatus Fermentibacterales bacterium]